MSRVFRRLRQGVERAVEHEPLHLHRQIASVRPSLPVTENITILAVMKSVTALEAKNRFGEVLEAAQRQPVSITHNSRPSVVMISAESYARRQRMAGERLRQAMRQAGEHAAAQGMNEQVLGQLLADPRASGLAPVPVRRGGTGALARGCRNG